MTGIVSKLLSNQEGLIALIVLILLVSNVVLTALKKGLDLLAVRAGSKWESQAASVVGALCVGLSKVLEFLTANSTVLPAKAQEELKAAAKPEEPKVSA